MTEPIYTYTIGGVHPHQAAPKELFEFVDTFCRGRAFDLDLTEQQYEGLADRMARIGITLREVSRIPYQKPEVVL